MAAAIASLLPQLSSSAPPFDPEQLQRIVEADATCLFAATDGAIVAGILTLVIAPIPTGFHAYIEDVVVDDRFRGRGVAKKLIQAAVDHAKRRGARKVELTSNPTRKAANHLYQSVGFEPRDTNAYRLLIADYSGSGS